MVPLRRHPLLMLRTRNVNLRPNPEGTLIDMVGKKQRGSD
jgi:hypothetical protein